MLWPIEQLRADARQNRARLISAATAAFAEKGADAPLEDIARRAGVGIGTLYRHFPNRLDLQAAVFRSLENLMTFPFVRAPVARGELNLHGAYFGVAEGSLFVLDQAAKEFHSVGE